MKANSAKVVVTAEQLKRINGLAGPYSDDDNIRKLMIILDSECSEGDSESQVISTIAKMVEKNTRYGLSPIENVAKLALDLSLALEEL